METSSKNHIDCIIRKGSEGGWSFPRFYGELITHKRHESWDLFRQLDSQFNLPWICSGDFNEIVRSSEEKGGINQSHAQMQLFHEVIDTCGFIDIGFRGSPYTWRNFFKDGNSIWERLNSSLANNEWLCKIWKVNCAPSKL